MGNNGSISFNQARNIPAAPVIPVTGADNGLHIVGTEVYLGGTLIEDTVIITGNNSLAITNPLGLGGDMLLIDDAIPIVQLGLSILGSGPVDQSYISFEPGEIFMQTTDYQGLSIIDSLALFAFGDTLDSVNGIKLLIDDNNRFAQLGDTSSVGSGTVFIVNDNIRLVAVTDNAYTALSLDLSGRIFAIGDVNGGGNGTKMSIDDSNLQISITNVGNGNFSDDFLVIDTNDVIKKITAPIESGVFTPTLTNTANITASTAFEGQYLRVGNTVTMSGRVNITPTLITTNAILQMTIPIPSTFTALGQCGGAASGTNGSPMVGGAILANIVTPDTVTLDFISTGTANRTAYFSFTYQIIPNVV